MARIVASWWFLVATGLCCGLGVGLASWAADDSPTANRVLAALIALGAGLGLMLLLAWGLGAEVPAPASPPRSATTAAVPPGPDVADARAQLAVYLDQGHALREELELGTSAGGIDAWIDRVRETIAQHKPGVAGYFHALAAKPYADDAQRLDAHIARLTTIVRELL